MRTVALRFIVLNERRQKWPVQCLICLGGNESKLYLGNAIWNRNSVYGTDQSVTLTIPKGAIGLRCTCSTNIYNTSFGNPSVGTVLFKESIGGESRGARSVVLIFTEPLKSDASIIFYYGSGSGSTNANFKLYYNGSSIANTGTGGGWKIIDKDISVGSTLRLAVYGERESASGVLNVYLK